MGVNRIKVSNRAPFGSVSSISGGSGRNPSASFQNQMGNQTKEHYRERVTALFDEIAKQSGDILNKLNLYKFEVYRGLISELLTEVIKNAFCHSSERVTDNCGEQRILSSVNIIDEKMKDLASDAMQRDIERIDYLSRIDEIRGLIMDLLS
jgi:uncharacterized protein